MTLALANATQSRRKLVGVAEPRIAPPRPARTLIKDWLAACKWLGIEPYPWQTIAAYYITALDRKDAWLFREIATIVARQNGKTELMLPVIKMGLDRGEQIIHTAQNRRLPRKVFLRLARKVEPLGWDVRRANGQEEIISPAGGRYALFAPNESARGEGADRILIDEVREQRDQELMDAMLPTITASPNAQINYFSNAGDGQSVVLNDLRNKAGKERRLAYLEWSAAPDASLDDRAGWAQANPALGHGKLTLETLEYFRANRPAASFEVEHLCRWADTEQPRIVAEAAWEMTRGQPEAPASAHMAVKLDPSGRRCSAALAWQQSDGRVALEVVLDEQGDPVDAADLGAQLRQIRARTKARGIGFDDWSDKELVKYLKGAKAINGREFANASVNFARLIDGGRLVWADAEAVGADLAWAGRKSHDQGAWQAVAVSDDRPVTALLAAIRATWLASGPRPPAPRIR